MIKYAFFLTALASCCSAQSHSTFSPLRPPALPLAVRSPYLSTWQQAGTGAGTGGILPGHWPTFWTGALIGWAGLVRVDNATYIWMGAPNGGVTLNVNQTAYEYTSTRSIFTMEAAGVELKITFLSPVFPDDLLRASLPYMYMDVDVHAIDGAQHTVQIYTDISAEWVSGDRSATAQWDYNVSVRPPLNPVQGGIAYHKVYRQQQLQFSETNNQADWGYWYYATQNTAKLTHQSGADATVRGQFVTNGFLANTADTQYRAINNNYPVFGFSVDLGSVSTSVQNTLFQLSLHQEQAVQFDGVNGIQSVPSLWTSFFSQDTDAVEFFYDDYSTGSSMATALDNRIQSDSIAAGGQNYADLTTLATRQAFGALEFTNTPTQPWIFLKEISSDGNVNTVDVIFPFHPIAIYANATLLRYLLDPLFINQEAGNWPNQFSLHDLGNNFPNATGHKDGNDEMQPLEECGDMLIMTLAYAQRTNDNAYLAQHYDILRQWNEYLVREALIPSNQMSTDDFAGSLANQTNLALKGIIGIEAMAQIANRTGHAADGANYTNIAHSYIAQWQQLGIAYGASPPHTTLAYGMKDTHGLLYNLFGDAELGLRLVPQSVYDMQSHFYSTAFNEYGVPLDTRHNYTKNDWEIFCAAVASEDTKNEFTSVIAKWLGSTSTNYAFTDLYDTISGDYPGITFIARPVVGGMFSFLALKSAPSSGYVSPAGAGS